MLLPASLLVLIALTPFRAATRELPWANDASSFRRRLAVGSLMDERLQKVPSLAEPNQQPIGVRKMSNDEGEMFFPEYWTVDRSSSRDGESYGNSHDNPPNSRLDKRKSGLRLIDPSPSDSLADNATMLPPLQAPFSLHANESHLPLLRRLFPFQKRQFSCPATTNACMSISRPNSCCPTDEVCQIVTDTGNGDVGCCSPGQVCSQVVTTCQQNYPSCPGAQGGGCCVPGSSCVGVGCVINSTNTVTVIPTVTQPASTPSSAAPSSLAPIIGSTQTFTVGTTILYTVTGSPLPFSSHISSLSSSSPSSSPSTPPPSTPPPPSTSATIPALIPLRPTSGSASITHTTTAPPLTSTIIPTQCPTGFYDCSAFAHPGCCRLGRDCALLSCPAVSTSLALASNGVTVGVAQVSDDGLGQDGCALGWFSCARQTGITGQEANGCCPSGYVCGASCTAANVLVGTGVTGTAKVAKNNRAGGRLEVGGGGGRDRLVLWMMVVGMWWALMT